MTNFKKYIETVKKSSHALPRKIILIFFLNIFLITAGIILFHFFIVPVSPFVIFFTAFICINIFFLWWLADRERKRHQKIKVKEKEFHKKILKKTIANAKLASILTQQQMKKERDEQKNKIITLKEVKEKLREEKEKLKEEKKREIKSLYDEVEKEEEKVKQKDRTIRDLNSRIKNLEEKKLKKSAATHILVLGEITFKIPYEEYKSKNIYICHYDNDRLNNLEPIIKSKEKKYKYFITGGIHNHNNPRLGKNTVTHLKTKGLIPLGEANTKKPLTKGNFIKALKEIKCNNLEKI